MLGSQLHITFWGSEVFEPLDDVLPGVPGAFTLRDWNWGRAAFDRLALHRHVDLDVLARRGDADVSEPRLDDVQLNAGLKQMHGGRVAKSVGADALGGEGRLVHGRCRDIAFEDRHHAEARDALAVSVQEEGSIYQIPIVALVEILSKCVRCLRPKRTDTLLATFPKDTHLGGRFEAQVLDIQAHHLGSPCARVVQQSEQRKITQTVTVGRGWRSQ